MSNKATTDKSRILKGVSLSWLKFFLTLLMGVIQTPLLFKYLSPLELNTWYIFFSFGAFLQVSDLGLVSSISRIIAYLDNSSDSQTDEKIAAPFRQFSTKQIYISALISFSVILVVSGLIVFFSYFLLQKTGPESGKLNLAFIVFIGGIIFNLISNIPTAVLDGHRDVGYDSIVRMVVQVLYFLSLLIFLPVFKSVLFVSCAFLVQNLFQFLSLHSILYTRHKKIFQGTLKLKELLKFQILKNVYSQSLPLAINQLGGWLTSQGSVLIASIVIGPNQLSDYVINQQLFSYGIGISLVINQIIGPFIAKQYIEKNNDNLIAYYKTTVIACLGIVCLFLAALLSSCNNIIGLWVGEQHFLGFHFAIIFALITFFEVQHSVAGNFVWNMGSWPFNKWTFAAGIINIVLGYILGKYFGLFGIAVATFVSKVVTLNWYVVFYCLKKIGMTISNYLGNVLGPLVISFLCTMAFVMYLKNAVRMAIINDFLFILSLSAISSIIFGLLILIFFRKLLKPILLIFNK